MPEPLNMSSLVLLADINDPCEPEILIDGGFGRYFVGMGYIRRLSSAILADWHDYSLSDLLITSRTEDIYLWTILTSYRSPSIETACSQFDLGDKRCSRVNETVLRDFQHFSTNARNRVDASFFCFCSSFLSGRDGCGPTTEKS